MLLSKSEAYLLVLSAENCYGLLFVILRTDAYTALSDLNVWRDLRIRYNYHLGLIVVVDKENHTQLAMQCLTQRERTEDFIFMFESLLELTEGVEPEVKQRSSRVEQAGCKHRHNNDRPRR